MERPVVLEAGQRIGLRLVLERRADVRVVDRERRGVGEADDELELLLGELLEPGAVDVERPLQRAARDERHHDQRLGIGWRIGDEPDARIQLGPVCEHRLPVLDRPAGDPHAERERLVREHLLGVDSARVHGAERLVDLVRLVERDVVVRDQVADGARDTFEQRVEALLRENLVEDVGQTPVRLDQRVVVSWRDRFLGRPGTREMCRAA